MKDNNLKLIPNNTRAVSNEMNKKPRLKAHLEVINFRNYLLKQYKIKLLKVFDTNTREFHKDVVMGKWKNKKVVVRVGEHRTKNFFPKGFKGKYFVVPKIYVWNDKENYEIEQFLPGTLFSDLLPKPKYNKLIVSEKWLKIIINAHWEFQNVAKKIKLPEKIDFKDKLIKYHRFAEKLIPLKNRQRVRQIVLGRNYKDFWTKAYPSKWKFAPDNLLALPKDKIGFVDLARVGKRHWGYDLGWLFWPQWFHFSKSDFLKVDEHFEHLIKYFNVLLITAPIKERKNQQDFYQKCYLILFERIIGALYDIQAKISHTLKMSRQQKKQMSNFLVRLLNLTLAKIN